MIQCATRVFIIGSILGSYLALGASACDHEGIASATQVSEVSFDDIDINEVAIVHGTEHLGSYQGNQIEGIEVSTFSIQPGQPRSTIHIGEVHEDGVLGFIAEVMASGILEMGGYDVSNGGATEFLIIGIGNTEYSYMAPAGEHELAVAEMIERLMLLLECGEGAVECDNTMICSLGMCVPL